MTAADQLRAAVIAMTDGGATQKEVRAIVTSALGPNPHKRRYAAAKRDVKILRDHGLTVPQAAAVLETKYGLSRSTAHHIADGSAGPWVNAEADRLYDAMTPEEREARFAELLPM